MIVTEGPTLEENLKRVTPWWDLITKYLIAAMMAIALTCIVVQVTKDSVVCVPAVDCSKSTPSNSSSNVNVSDDSAKLCQSLTPKSSKKIVLAKMVDRRLYDYVDSVCFQKMCWFTKFFPLFLLGQVVFLLVLDILWTKLPFSSSVLHHFVALTDECYSLLATFDIILGRSETLTSRDESANIPEAEILRVLNLVQKTENCLEELENQKCLCFFPKSLCLYSSYMIRCIFQILICFGSLVINSLKLKNFGKTFQFQCLIDEFVFTKEYDHFECSHQLAPNFEIAVILFMIFLVIQFIISLVGVILVCRHGHKYTFPEEGMVLLNNDLAFLFYLLTQYNKLYAEKVSYFFRKEEKLPEKVLSFLKAKYNNPSTSSA